MIELAARLRDAGAQEVGFGDTTGMANPRQVREFFAAARAELGSELELTAHFHNTRGQGLANVLAALEAGVDSFESSFGELGGCPVPAGATGNIATEDLVSMLHEMGIETGIDLPALLACARARRRSPRAARSAATRSSPGRSTGAAAEAGAIARRPRPGARRRLRRPLPARARSLARVRPRSTPARRPPSRASARARGAPRRRSRAWLGRRRCASWRAARRRAPAWPTPARRARPRG